MQIFYAFILVVFSPIVFAGDYYNPGQIDTYDQSTGLYFKAVERVRDERGFMSSKAAGPATININVFDPATGKSRLLFKDPVGGMITAVLFEVGFKDGSIEFSGQESAYVKNNRSVALRDLKGKILIAVRGLENNETILLVADKRIGNPVRVATVPAAADWHIDVKNSKIRVVHQTGQGVQLESYEW